MTSANIKWKMPFIKLQTAKIKWFFVLYSRKFERYIGVGFFKNYEWKYRQNSSLSFFAFQFFFRKYVLCQYQIQHRCPQEVLLGKGVLKICSKFTGERLCQNVISNVLLFATLIEIKLRHGCSPVNLLHIFRTSFPKNISWGLLLSTFDSLLNSFFYIIVLYFIYNNFICFVNLIEIKLNVTKYSIVYEKADEW